MTPQVTVVCCQEAGRQCESSGGVPRAGFLGQAFTNLPHIHAHPIGETESDDRASLQGGLGNVVEPACCARPHRKKSVTD